MFFILGRSYVRVFFLFFFVSFDAVGLLKAIALFKLSMNEHKTQMIKTRKTSRRNEDCYLLSNVVEIEGKVRRRWEFFLTHFRHNRAQNYAPAQIQPSLTEVYEAEIRRLREENHYLRIQHNSITTQLNEVVAQLQQSKREFDSRSLCYSFLFLRGSFKIRNS